MSRRRRRRRNQGDVELNLAAMLDMAFQLLTFFILTFRPSPIEGQLSLHLPPPVPVTNVKPEQPVETDSNSSGFASTNSLIITVRSNPKGDVTSVSIGPGRAFNGPANQHNMHEFDRKLKQVFGIQQTPYDQVLIRVAPTLRYEELMKVIETCTRQKLPDGTLVQKISFTELTEGTSAQ